MNTNLFYLLPQIFVNISVLIIVVILLRKEDDEK